jgi:uncharacterized protein YraI
MSRVLMLTSVVLLSTVLPALASVPAQTAGGSWVNIRSGPGSGYPVVGVAFPRRTFQLHNCDGNWCNVTFRGRNGWMSRNWIAGR